VFFLKDRPAFSSTRDNDAGCAVTSFSAFNLAASSGIVMSDSASTRAEPSDAAPVYRRQADVPAEPAAPILSATPDPPALPQSLR
jgi:hypothetical protein